MNILSKYATPRIIIALFALLVLFEVLFMQILGPRFLELSNGTNLLDMTTFYSADQAYEMIENYGPDGRAFYNYVQLADLFFPVVYTLFFAALLTYLLKRRNLLETRWRRLALFPLLAGLCDWLENAGIFTMLHLYPARMDTVATFTNLFCMVKFGGIGLSLLVIIVIAARRK